MEGRRERRRQRRAAMLADKQRRGVGSIRTDRRGDLDLIDPSGFARFVALFATNVRVRQGVTIGSTRR